MSNLDTALLAILKIAGTTVLATAAVYAVVAMAKTLYNEHLK